MTIFVGWTIFFRRGAALLGFMLVAALAWPQATNSASPSSARVSGWRWSNLSVDLPTSQTAFPQGEGSELTPQCLICHSAGMVLRQPPLTRDQWVTEINKMRSAYGATLAADQVDRLADYLYRINGLSPTDMPHVESN